MRTKSFVGLMKMVGWSVPFHCTRVSGVKPVGAESACRLAGGDKSLGLTEDCVLRRQKRQHESHASKEAFLAR
jgi:hypothetical protein